MTKEEFNNTKWHKGMRAILDIDWLPKSSNGYEITGVDFVENQVKIINSVWFDLKDIVSLVSEEGGKQ